MDYSKFYRKKDIPRKRYSATEKKNLRRIALSALISIIAGMLVGAIIIAIIAIIRCVA